MQKSTKSVLLGLFLMAASYVNAQNLAITGGDFYISGPATSPRLESHLEVENSANNAITVLLNCDKSQMVFGHQTYYCWALCYDTTVCTAPDPLTVQGRTTDMSSFHSYLYPNNIAGTSTISYTFFNQNDPSDSASASITYDVLSNGVNEVERGFLSPASPNPAVSFASINYNLPTLGNGHVYMYNVLGVMVKDYVLTNKQSMLVMNTEELNPGIYTYTLVNDGRIVSSNRLIVGKR